MLSFCSNNLNMEDKLINTSIRIDSVKSILGRFLLMVNINLWIKF